MSEHEAETQDEPVEPAAEPGLDEEADDDEAATGTEAGGLEPEPTPEQPTDEERSKMFAKIDRSFSTYKSAVERNLDDELPDWLFCPLCAAGSVPGFVNRHDLGRVPDEVTANVKTFLGFARETDYPEATGIGTCRDCAGLGKVSTGSRVAEHMTITCPACKGYGYVPPPGAGAIIGGGNGTIEHANSEALADLEQPERDNWGEPRVLPDGTLNGNYGKMPQFKQVHPVYGVTASLAPEELISG